MLRIVIDPLTDARVLALIDHHQRRSSAQSPPERAFVLGVDALRAPGLTLYTAWEGDQLLGMAALGELDAEHGEIKSMRTVDAARGRGVGAALLDHALGAARRRGYTRVSLETGTSDAYAPARRLYERAGFRPCPPFAAYDEDAFNTYYSLKL